MRKQSGFTIIELVVVIILLGIMAATALPRFMDVTDTAHTAVVDGVQGGLQSGMALFHGQWVAEGQDPADTVITAFGNLRTNASGYPYGTANNSAGTSDVTNNGDCTAIFANILQAGAPSTGEPADLKQATLNALGTDFGVAFGAGPICEYYYIAASVPANPGTVPMLSYAPSTGAITLGTKTVAP